MKGNFICPNPVRWHEMFKNLSSAYEEKTGTKLPEDHNKAWDAGGPPVPLILSGWACTSDLEKSFRWQQTLMWADDHGLLHLTEVKKADKHYLSGYLCNNPPAEYEGYTERIRRRFNMQKYITPDQYRSDPKSVKEQLPDKKGIYFVMYPYYWPEYYFKEKGSGGFFKGKDPNVDMDRLWEKWVQEADILYIGKAGDISANGIEYKATLRKRVIQLLQFGDGKKVGHWGGRYLWQHEASPDFRIYCYACQEDENPVSLEKELIKEFEQEYHKKPFANH